MVPGFQNFTGHDPGRHAAAQHGHPAATTNPSNLGLIGGDPAGFPNGRRVFDDVVTIELRAIAGATLPLVDPSFTPDAAAGAISMGLTSGPTDLTAMGTENYLSYVPLPRGAPRPASWPAPRRGGGMGRTPGGTRARAQRRGHRGAGHRGHRGAAVVFTPASLVGAEIEIRPADRPWDGTHTAVRRRDLRDTVAYAGVFGSLEAGAYQLRMRGDRGRPR